MNNIAYQTRQLSFNDIKLKKEVRYEQILSRLDKPKTAKEIAVELYDMGIIPSTERNYTAPRLTELWKRGIVEIIGKKKCNYTGKMVAVYQKTDDIKKMQEENMSHIPQLF